MKSNIDHAGRVPIPRALPTFLVDEEGLMVLACEDATPVTIDDVRRVQEATHHDARTMLPRR
jgi:hypothetical protein